jgi:hypothetical protein
MNDLIKRLRKMECLCWTNHAGVKFRCAPCEAADALEGLASDAVPRRVEAAIRKTLSEYRLKNQHYDDGQGAAVALVDALTPANESEITRGKQELELLADDLTAEVIAALAQEGTPTREATHQCAYDDCSYCEAQQGTPTGSKDSTQGDDHER